MGDLLTDQHTSKKCLGFTEDLESHRNVTLDISSLRVIVKNSRGKKQQEETKKQQHVIVTEIKLFKGFTTEGVKNYHQK